MKLYGLKTCDTCRKALKALPDAEFVDVRADAVPSDVLAHPTLMKRPLIVVGDEMYLGFDAKTQAALGL